MSSPVKPQHTDHQLSDHVITHRRFIWVLMVGLFLLSATLALLLVLKNFGQTYQQINLTQALRQNSLSHCWVIKLPSLEAEPLFELFEAPANSSTTILHQSADPYLVISNGSNPSQKEISVFLKKKNSYIQTSWMEHLNGIDPDKNAELLRSDFGYLALKKSSDSPALFETLSANTANEDDLFRTTLQDPQVAALYYGSFLLDPKNQSTDSKETSNSDLIVIKLSEFLLYPNSDLSQEPVVFVRQDSDDPVFDQLKRILNQDMIQFLE